LPLPEDFINWVGCLARQVIYPLKLMIIVFGLLPVAKVKVNSQKVIYRLFPQAQACYHVHSVEANLVCRFAHLGKLSLPPLEMLKGLGIWVENPEVFMPVFANYLDVPKIAAEIESRFSTFPPEIPALLISDHGVTVWGESLETTENYLEIVEYIFRYLVLRRI